MTLGSQQLDALVDQIPVDDDFVPPVKSAPTSPTSSGSGAPNTSTVVEQFQATAAATPSPSKRPVKRIEPEESCEYETPVKKAKTEPVELRDPNKLLESHPLYSKFYWRNVLPHLTLQAVIRQYKDKDTGAQKIFKGVERNRDGKSTEGMFLTPFFKVRKPFIFPHGNCAADYPKEVEDFKKVPKKPGKEWDAFTPEHKFADATRKADISLERWDEILEADPADPTRSKELAEFRDAVYAETDKICEFLGKNYKLIEPIAKELLKDLKEELVKYVHEISEEKLDPRWKPALAKYRKCVEQKVDVEKEDFTEELAVWLPAKVREKCHRNISYKTKPDTADPIGRPAREFLQTSAPAWRFATKAECEGPDPEFQSQRARKAWYELDKKKLPVPCKLIPAMPMDFSTFERDPKTGKLIDPPPGYDKDGNLRTEDPKCVTDGDIIALWLRPKVILDNNFGKCGLSLELCHVIMLKKWYQCLKPKRDYSVPVMEPLYGVEPVVYEGKNVERAFERKYKHGADESHAEVEEGEAMHE